MNAPAARSSAARCRSDQPAPHLVDPSGDPLRGIDPPAYCCLLTGKSPNSQGKLPCPLHDDSLTIAYGIGPQVASLPRVT